MQKRTYSPKTIFLLFLVSVFTFLILFISSCKEEEAGLIFSHKKHTEVGGEIELACETCHQIAENGVKFTIPTHNECSS